MIWKLTGIVVCVLLGTTWASLDEGSCFAAPKGRNYFLS